MDLDEYISIVLSKPTSSAATSNDVKMLKVLQVNLHHSRTNKATLCIKEINHVLIQESWVVKGRISGLGIYNELVTTTVTPTAEDAV